MNDFTCVDAFSKVYCWLTDGKTPESCCRKKLCSLWNKQCTPDVFNGAVSSCRQQQWGRDAHACMNFLCFYTWLVHFCLSTGGIIYNPVLLNSGMRKTLYCGEYISRYEESPETGHFMDQQEPKILRWAESCSAGVCTPSSSASARRKMALNAPQASQVLLKVP